MTENHPYFGATSSRKVRTLRRLIGEEFEVNGVAFAGVEGCRPCYWMDQAFAPGAEKLLRHRGGLRARILRDGCLCLTDAVPAA